jgi:hypothetical protein
MESDLVKAQKELIALQLQLEEKKHEMKMKELIFIRESERLKHELELERGRIKSAEIRKTLMRKYDQDPFKQ